MAELAFASHGDAIDQVLERIDAAVPPDQRSPAAVFGAAYLDGVPVRDLAGMSVDDLRGAVLSLWQFGLRRPNAGPSVRVFTPTVDEHGWHTGHTVVEVVNDDMPFLVDSVVQALLGRGVAVHLVIHPILRVARDGDCCLSQVRPATDISPATKAESFIQIQIDAQPDASVHAEIEAALHGVLADVRDAVEDWADMRDRLRAVVRGLQESPPPVAQADIDEVVEFLRWLDDGHFICLGYREYGFAYDGDEVDLHIIPDRGLGILRQPEVSVFEGLRHYAALPIEIQHFMRRPQLLMVTKANRRATVHRRVFLDTVIVKVFDGGGSVIGETMFAGLFTSVAYQTPAREIPILRQRIDRTIRRAGLAAVSHDAKAFAHILNAYPRDELFQVEEDDLLETARGILQLQDRPNAALFARRDPYERFVSCLVYLPRDSYSTALRETVQAILTRAYRGRVLSFSIELGQDQHARVHVVIATTPGQIPDTPVSEIEAELIEVSRSWTDRLRRDLVAAKGEGRGLALMARYAEAFPTAYREVVAIRAAMLDIDRIERVLADGRIVASLSRPAGAPEHQLGFRLYHRGDPVPLSDVLPVLENMGFRVLSEVPHEVRPTGVDGDTVNSVWIHDFVLETRGGIGVDLDTRSRPLRRAFVRIWYGDVEDDSFNRLVLRAGLDWRSVVVLRAYARYLQQARFEFSRGAIAEALNAHPAITRLLIALFQARFDLASDLDRSAMVQSLAAEVEAALDAVENLNEDRILRRLVNVIRATLRTNFHQMAADGEPKPYLSFKLDSGAVEDLPLPRPWREIFVYSPRVEGVHLRGGRVARGGIRWSDRREDFRTEVLGLMKAQMVKNAVIVPVGSKGGFVVKRPPPGGDRQAQQQEGIACYQTFIRGLLDLTDNLVDGQVVPPSHVVRHDDDDTYLVVAADKGTATFSDIANAISQDYGYWLDDAFASGGSVGYDHKKMGITARGAWESVKRHFRELGVDTQSAPFSVIGVGDMSGDVFGNGMLLSPHTRLLAAFNHLHIFIDPDPDPARSFAERQRLFDLGRGSWDLYDPDLLSTGGGVFSRQAKSIRLSPEAQARFGLDRPVLTPAALISALLRAEVDLLWFGGIGTYVKAAHETQAAAGDKANDGLRVNAEDLRARAIGEGANLAVTQGGRIAFARNGGRVNTDFIDNSAGVDCSDHEVNIKILLTPDVAAGAMSLEARNRLLDRMTDAVAELVLRDNYLQTQAISVEEHQASARLDGHARFMRTLERAGNLDREIELLPDDAALEERAAAGEGLTRPELSILLASAKIDLHDRIMDSDLPDDPFLEQDLLLYFPQPLQDDHRPAILGHPLRRELIATYVVNSMINRTGPTFFAEMAEKTGLGAADVTRAYLIVRDSYRLRGFWERIQALDTRVSADIQTRMMQAIRDLVARQTAWVLRTGAPEGGIGAAIDRFRVPLSDLSDSLGRILPEAMREGLEAAAEQLTGAGVPVELAQDITALVPLSAGLDLIAVAERAGQSVAQVAPLYFDLGSRVGFDALRAAAQRATGASHWHTQAIEAIVDDIDALQAELATRICCAPAQGNRGEPVAVLEAWEARNRPVIERIGRTVSEVRSAANVDVAMLAVAGRRLRGMASAI